MDYTFILTTFTSIFAIVNPLGSVPNYAALTQGYNRKEKKRVIKKAVAVAFGVLLIFTLVGHLIFKAMNITVDAFSVAGGVVLFIIALEMVRGRTPQSKLNDKEKEDLQEKELVGIVPLGVPLLAGPGAITTVMLMVSKGSKENVDVLGLSINGWLFTTTIVVGSALIVCAASYLILRNSDLIFERLGRTRTRVMSRLMGLLLAAIAVEFIAKGLKGLFESEILELLGEQSSTVLSWLI